MTVFIELFLIGVGLAMDAFAASVCKGLAMRKINKKQMLTIGIFFGGFQAFMPFLGWMLGRNFERYIVAVDHWIAFVLLGYIGGKMLFESIKSKDEAVEIAQMDAPLDLKELTVMAIATSIDALAVGITFAFLSYPIGPAVAIIGISTFFICLAGVVIGNIFGSKYKSKAEFAGGLILIIIGTKILVEHLGIFG